MSATAVTMPLTLRKFPTSPRLTLRKSGRRAAWSWGPLTPRDTVALSAMALTATPRQGRHS